MIALQDNLGTILWAGEAASPAEAARALWLAVGHPDLSREEIAAMDSAALGRLADFEATEIPEWLFQAMGGDALDGTLQRNITLLEAYKSDSWSLRASLTEAGVAKVRAWLDQVGQPGLREQAILSEIENRIVDLFPDAERFPYELGLQYTTTGRPELLTLKSGEDFEVEISAEEM